MDWFNRVPGRQNPKPAPPAPAADDPPQADATELKAAMTLVANRDTPANRRSLYETLLRASLMLATPDPGDDVRRVAEVNEQIELIAIKDDEGKTVWPAFTDEQALLTWKPDGGGYVQMPALAVFQMMLGSDTDRIVINPASTPAGFVTRHEARVLADGGLPIPESAQATRIELTQDTKMLIGAPAQPPPQRMIERVRAELRAFPLVDEALLFVSSTGGEPHLTLGLRLGGPMEERAFAAMAETIGAAAVAELPRDTYLDVLVLDEVLHRTIRNTVTPLYTREHA